MIASIGAKRPDIRNISKKVKWKSRKMYMYMYIHMYTQHVASDTVRKIVPVI